MENLDLAIGKLTIAFETLTKEYGPSTVDAVRYAYIIDSWTAVVWLVLSVLGLVSLIIFTVKVQIPWVRESNDNDAPASYVLTILAVFLFVVIICNTSPLEITAAFGYPEPLIASKILQGVVGF